MGRFRVFNGVKGILDNFQSVGSNNPKVSKPLRASKNGKRIGFLSLISKENKKKKFQKLPQEFKPFWMEAQNNQIDFEDNFIDLMIIILLKYPLLLILKTIYELLNYEKLI